MKFTISIKTLGLNIESETDNFDDIEPLVNASTYALDEIRTHLPEPETAPTIEPEVQVQIDPASDGQLQYMKKLGLQIPANCSKAQAITIINDYKKQHGIPVNPNYSKF